MKFIFFKKGKKFSVEVNEALGLRRGLGLIFRTANTKNLLFRFKEPSRIAITGLFVFFPFFGIWIDKKKKIIEHKMFRPFEFSYTPRRKASYFIELPVNRKNSKTIEGISDDFKYGFSS